jgi:pimeloyl-ACP methyl ester carboxylesterase
MKSLLLAAALATIAAPLPVAARPAPSATAVGELAHVRTTLHGRSGPVVVLIPGMSTPGAVWDDMATKLAPDHRVLVVEVKGFDGVRTPANEGAGLIDGIVRDLAADLERRGFKKPVVVGHSFGGLTAMKLALARPDIARSIVVVDALPFFGTVFGEKETVESIAPRAGQMRAMMVAQADAIRAAAAKGVTKDPGGTMSLDPAARLRIANWSLRADPLVVGQAMAEDLAMDLRPDIAAIRVPMTVLYQAHENAAFAAKRYGTDYAAKPDARLVPVTATGHFIQLDQPTVVEDAIRDATK